MSDEEWINAGCPMTTARPDAGEEREVNQYDGSAKQEYDRLVSRHHDDLAKLRAAEARVKELEADNTRARNLVRQSQEDYDGQRKAKAAAEAEVARLKAELESSQRLAQANYDSWQTVAERLRRTRA